MQLNTENIISVTFIYFNLHQLRFYTVNSVSSKGTCSQMHKTSETKISKTIPSFTPQSNVKYYIQVQLWGTCTLFLLSAALYFYFITFLEGNMLFSPLNLSEICNKLKI